MPLMTTALKGAPGNTLTIAASSGLTGAVLTLQGQGYPLDTYGTPGIGVLVLSTSSASDTSISFRVPDGVLSGTIAVTNCAATGFVDLEVRSQYVQAADYLGEGVDVSQLAPGELDHILQRASAYADSFVGFSLRSTPVFETHTWRTVGRSKAPQTRIYPNEWPITTFDQFTVRISTVQYANFNVGDIVVNNDERYIEILSYAVASFTLLGAIQNLGLVANIVELSYIAGYALNRYPQELVEATTMIATELLDYRSIQAKGLGGLDRVRQNLTQYDRRADPFAIPLPAKELLRPFAFRRLG